MNYKKIIGIVIFVCGIVMFFLSNYISEQVNEVKYKISNAEKQVQQGKSLFSLSPYTKGIGDKAASSAQKKIDAGKNQVTEYEQIANLLHIGGIVFVILGAGIFMLGFINKKQNRR